MIEIFWLEEADFAFAAPGTWMAEAMDDDGDPADHAGWYWWPCCPGCLPDGDPSGPFETEAEAQEDAKEDVEEQGYDIRPQSCLH